MFMYYILSLIILLVISVLIFINYFLSMKSNNDREKPNPFECGFNPITNSNFPFSMQFFLISIMFLIFDIEILLLMPSISSLNLNNLSMSFFSTFLIYIIIFISTIFEWTEQSILWLN